MNSLKSALGKDEKVKDKLTSNNSVSRNRFSNSKSDSMWAFQGDDINEQESLNNDKKLDVLNKLLKSAFEKDHKLSTVTFDRIVQDFQEQVATSPNKSELSYYLVLQDKTTDLIDLFSKNKSEYLKYLQEFHTNIQQRISALRNKDKTVHLKNYETIAGNNNNFKKKPDFLDVAGIKLDVNPRSKSRPKQQNTSNQKKLNRLLSKEKDFKQKQTKKQHQDHDDYFLSQSMAPSNESVSYSAVMSTSVAVKQRRPRKRSTKIEDFHFNKTEMKDKRTVQNEEQGEKTDKAFIFFRPKKGGKN